MTLASTKYKLKYNRGTYRRYEFNLGLDSKLNALLERYKTYPGSNMSLLIKTCLCDHFGITIHEADIICPEYVFTKDGIRMNTELDKYFDNLATVNLDSSNQ